MLGSCKCKNIEVYWQTVDHSVVPRKCQCHYCKEKDAAYVSKSGTRFEVKIHNENFHKTVQHGTNSAIFHECAYCNELVFVTAEVDSERYGALNANCLEKRHDFSQPVEMDFSYQTAEEKLERWRQNWCEPVLITRRASAHATRAGRPTT